MCNQAAFNGKKADINKLRLLSIFGRDRGKDSNGILWNGKLYHGVWETGVGKDYGDALNWMQMFDFGGESVHNGTSVLIHNRSKTMGYANKENAHPFVFDIPGTENKFFFMHNGKFDDVDKLAKLVGLDEKAFTVDSKFLGYGIMTKGYEILKDYEGNASCMFTLSDRPDELYVWKGAHYTSSTKTILNEERPLFYYYDKTDKGFYFNSVKTPLEVISNFDKEANIQEVPTNSVLHFKAGKLIEITKIDRQVVIDNTYKHDYDYTSNVRTRGLVITSSTKEIDPYENKRTQLSGNKVYYHDGSYHKAGIRLHGRYGVSSYDFVVVSNAGAETSSMYHTELLFFYNGFWIKDEATYSRLIKKHDSQVYFTDMHPQSVAVAKSDGKTFYIGTRPIGNRILKPRFFEYFITYRNSKVVNCSITYTMQPNEGKLLSAFNNYYKISCKTLAECENANLKVTGEPVDWDEILEFATEEEITLLQTTSKSTLDMLAKEMNEDYTMLKEGVTKFLQDFAAYEQAMSEDTDYAEALDQYRAVKAIYEEYFEEEIEDEDEKNKNLDLQSLTTNLANTWDQNESDNQPY